MAENILTVENLNIAYQGVPAVMDVNFTLERGKVLTIVGESGSGKTTVIRALMGLLPVGGEVTEGSMIFNGHDLRNLSKSEWRSLRGKDMAMIFQDSGSALDPVLLIGDEPTSALDVTTQSQVVMQMLELSKQHNSAIVMVTHNLGVAAYMSDYIVVMKKGRVVDAGTPQDILENPSNEYTKQLKNAVPTLGGGRYID